MPSPLMIISYYYPTVNTEEAFFIIYTSSKSPIHLSFILLFYAAAYFLSEDDKTVTHVFKLSQKTVICYSICMLADISYLYQQG